MPWASITRRCATGSGSTTRGAPGRYRGWAAPASPENENAALWRRIRELEEERDILQQDGEVFRREDALVIRFQFVAATSAAADARLAARIRTIHRTRPALRRPAHHRRTARHRAPGQPQTRRPGHTRDQPGGAAAAPLTPHHHGRPGGGQGPEPARPGIRRRLPRCQGDPVHGRGRQLRKQRATENLNASFKRETLQGTQTWGSAGEARLATFGRPHRYERADERTSTSTSVAGNCGQRLRRGSRTRRRTSPKTSSASLRRLRSTRSGSQRSR
jgi:hypothetical protein